MVYTARTPRHLELPTPFLLSGIQESPLRQEPVVATTLLAFVTSQSCSLRARDDGLSTSLCDNAGSSSFQHPAYPWPEILSWGRCQLLVAKLSVTEVLTLNVRTFKAVATNFNLSRGYNSSALAGQPAPNQKFFLSLVTRPWKEDLQSGNLFF